MYKNFYLLNFLYNFVAVEIVYMYLKLSCFYGNNNVERTVSLMVMINDSRAIMHRHKYFAAPILCIFCSRYNSGFYIHMQVK